MKQIIIIFSLSLLLLAACQPIDHIGCQEGEIDQEGNCIPAEQNNVNLFEQNLDHIETYDIVNGKARGFLATPSEEGTYPGVLMIHEWWGLNDNIKEMAKILANEGYVVFAVDLYGGEVANTSEKARELATSVRSNPEEAVATMQASVAFLKSQGVQSVGSLGWCFGGQQSLQISLNEELDATVIYYGSLVDDKEQLQNLNGPVLGVFGENDTSIPVDEVNNFKTALNDLNIQNNIYIYKGVGHAFANPSGSNYAKESTEDAWAKTVDFLNENLKE